MKKFPSLAVAALALAPLSALASENDALLQENNNI